MGRSSRRNNVSDSGAGGGARDRRSPLPSPPYESMTNILSKSFSSIEGLGNSNRQQNYIADVVNTINNFTKYPLGQIRFITCKDNRQSKKWKKLDTFRSWMRKYFTAWTIVQSPAGGIHYHALGVLKKSPLPLKGIHFKIDHVKKIYEQDKFTISVRLVGFPRACALQELCEEVRRYIPPTSKDYCLVHEPPLIERRKFRLIPLIQYLKKNLMENNTIEPYDHFNIKCD